MVPLQLITTVVSDHVARGTCMINLGTLQTYAKRGRAHEERVWDMQGVYTVNCVVT